MDTFKLYNKRANNEDELEITLSNDKFEIATILATLKTKFIFQRQVDYYIGDKRARSATGAGTIFQTKKHIKSEVIDNLKVNLKQEIPLESTKFNRSRIDTARIKYVNMYYLKGWRLDYSRVFKSSFAESRIATSNLQKSTSIDDPLLELFNHELELECTTSTADYTECMALIRSLFGDNSEKFDILNELAQIKYQFTGLRAGHKSIKTMLPNPEGLTRKQYQFLWPERKNLLITEKADGERAILYGPKGLILSDTKYLKVKVRKEILDGELVDDVFYAFDMITKGDFKARYAKLSKLTGVKVKKMSPIEDALKVYKAKHPYSIDGLIVIDIRDDYFNTKSYKWKEDHTIDLLVVKSQIKHEYHLYCTVSAKVFETLGIKKELFEKNDLKDIFIKTNNVFPIRFATPRDPKLFRYPDPNGVLDKLVTPCICEFSYTGAWEFIKERTDRADLLKQGVYFGNKYEVAEEAIEMYYLPLKIEELTDYSNSSYFQPKNELYRKMTGYMSMVKENILSIGEGNLVDLGCGRGADIGRYKKFYESVVGIDPDNEALSEFMSRLKNHKGHLEARVFNISMQNISSKPFSYPDFKYWANAVTCNFSIHYMIKNLQDMNHLVDVIDMFLKKKGFFIFTCFDGNEILKLKSFEKMEDGVLKYSIRNRSKSSEITLNEIELILPFSAGKYYTENLVDVGKIVNRFESKGYTLIKRVKTVDEWKCDLKGVDLEFASLFTVVVIQKNK
jgi:hypothetical protein